MIEILKSYGQQALANLNAAKLRTALAILGILVGTAAVVALMTCSRLATDKALEQFKALGTNLLAISVYQHASSLNGKSERNQEIPLTLWRQLPAFFPEIKQIAPYSLAHQSISYAGKTLEGVIVGADDHLAKIIHIKLAAGQFISFIESFERVCIIGADLATQIEQVTLQSPLGQQLHLGQTLYTIVGIAKPWQENGFFNEDINHTVIIPIAGIAQVSQNSNVNNAIMLLASHTAIDSLVARLQHFMQQQAPTMTVFIRSAKQIIANLESQSQIFSLLLAVIGAIALIVGGIGVMNVMLVAVNERRKEIGIRKALGAKNREIYHLFLVESLLLALFGGISGMLIGLSLSWLIAYFSAWPFHFYSLPMLAGFAISTLTGVFFGFYPARRAALLEPIASLRTE